MSSNTFFPGVPTHTRIRFPRLSLNQAPSSPILGPRASASNCSSTSGFLSLLSTIHAPLLHWPADSTLMSDGGESRQVRSFGRNCQSLIVSPCWDTGFWVDVMPRRLASSAYQTQRASCKTMNVASCVWPVCKVSIFWKACFMNAECHSARGEPFCKRWDVRAW